MDCKCGGKRFKTCDKELNLYQCRKCGTYYQAGAVLATDAARKWLCLPEPVENKIEFPVKLVELTEDNTPITVQHVETPEVLPPEKEGFLSRLRHAASAVFQL